MSKVALVLQTAILQQVLIYFLASFYILSKLCDVSECKQGFHVRQTSCEFEDQILEY